MHSKGQQWAAAIIATLTATAASATTATPATTPTASAAAPQCYGIARAAKNACGTIDHTDHGVLVKGHACAGLSTEDANCYEWLPIPAPLCAKFVVTINGKNYSGFTSPSACIAARAQDNTTCTSITLEPCYGIAKKTKGTTNNPINVPKGSCLKIKGGRLTP